MRTTLIPVLLALLAGPSAADEMALQRCVWACLAQFGPNTNPAYHQCVSARCTPASAPVATIPAVPAGPSNWGDLDGLIRQTLGVSGANYWLPDSADPMQATQAVAFSYYMLPGGGNAQSLRTGLYLRVAEHFQLAGVLDGLFGLDPRNVRFTGTAIELNTTMPAPGDPRCCPTAEALWSIDVATMRVTRLR
jgi:hypothetical protein